MEGGFSFCGTNIADIGLEYAPDNDKTYVYAPGSENIHDEAFDSHDGGYFYGASKQPKEFVLRCFYEDKNIAEGLMANVYSLFRIGKTGLLIFERRPWCYYYATVTNVDISNLHSYLNGLVVVTMKAYYPYARGLSFKDKNGGERLLCNLPTDLDHKRVMLNTALLDQDIAPPTVVKNVPMVGKDIILFNPGTERAAVSIVISGTTTNASGVTITNKTTGQTCRYHAFNDINNPNEHVDSVETDGISGKTIVNYSSTERELAFLYHDYGFIELEPAFPIRRNIFASCTSSTVSTTNILYKNEAQKEWYTGKYIYLVDNWYKIQKCANEYTLWLDGGKQVEAPLKRTSIVKMNEIFILPEQGTTITEVSFLYKPTYA